MLMYVWVLLKDSIAVLTEIIRNTLDTMLYCKVQIEHKHFFIVYTLAAFRWNHNLLSFSEQQRAE